MTNTCHGVLSNNGLLLYRCLMSKTTPYYIFGNKLYYPSTNQGHINNHLSNEDIKTANLFKPNSYGPTVFGTDRTNTYMNDRSKNPYDNLVFYYQLINQRY